MATGSQGKQASLFKQRAEPKSPRRVECPHYSPIPDSRRCRHYLDSGGCDRPDELMCREWLKKNGQAPPAVPAETTGQANSPPEADARPQKASPVQAASDSGSDRSCEEPEPPSSLPGLTAEDIASFKALGVEVGLSTEDLGELWLVPCYSGKDRQELTPEHAATLLHVLSVFPGARVTAFEKLQPEGQPCPGEARPGSTPVEVHP